MTVREKVFHGFLIGILFSVANWLIIDELVMNLSIAKYIFIEFILVISVKLFKFTKLKLKLN